jgi:hypothetical protein
MPKRPTWSMTEGKEAVDARETRYFEQWLKAVYDKYSADRLNYFEHNLEVFEPLFHFPHSLN